MSEQDGAQETALERPANDDVRAWREYWKVQGQSWRTEPEISKKRQHYLAERRKIKTNINLSIYPFKGIKLKRADIEWLLATHENNLGKYVWNDDSLRELSELELRYADLQGENLQALPLARIIAGPRTDLLNALPPWNGVEKIHLEHANLHTAHLQDADLRAANLENAQLFDAHLERADFSLAYLLGANLRKAYLQSAKLRHAHLIQADLSHAHLERADLTQANLQGADLSYASLEGTNLLGAHLERADLSYASLEGADLRTAYLEGANLNHAHLERADLSHAHLEGANLNSAFFDSATNLQGIGLSNNLDRAASLADIHWGDVNVAVVDWSTISRLGDENEAKKALILRTDQYERAARAYRQLSVVLRNQGLNEHAARFAYRAQLMQRKVFWHQHKFLQYLGSRFLALVSGYGYKVGRCFIAYALVIGVFATIYHLLGTHPAWNESIVISMTAFHGRGFFPEQFHPGDPQALAAAIEAFVGLLIEITLIATLTQRFFGK